jgi:hypothetical protein
MADETSIRNSIEAARGSNTKTRCTFSFNHDLSNDVVVRLLNGSGDGKEGEPESLELHLHRKILVENSSFFSAQLSDRWEAACTRDVAGRPILVIKDCEKLGDFSIALQKLYQRAPSELEGSPVYTFYGFEDAHRCLRPADQLYISSVLSSALEYLESIPWTTDQTEQLLESLARMSIATFDAQKLIDRTEPPPEGLRTALLDRILVGATASGDPATLKGSRAFVQKIMERNLSRPSSRSAAGAFALGLQRCISRLQQVFLRMRIETRFDYHVQAVQDRTYDHNAELTKLVGDLAWIFQLPQSQIKTDEGCRRADDENPRSVQHCVQIRLLQYVQRHILPVAYLSSIHCGTPLPPRLKSGRRRDPRHRPSAACKAPRDVGPSQVRQSHVLSSLRRDAGGFQCGTVNGGCSSSGADFARVAE